MRFLSDRNRLRILRLLLRQQLCVSEVMASLDLPQDLVSYHLARLREAGLVRTHRRGRRVYYALERHAWNTFTQGVRDLCQVVELSP